LLIAESIVPAAMAVPGTPPPLDAYGELPQVEDAALSPDGTSIASVTHTGGERRVIVLKNNEVVLNASSGTTKVRAIEWADNDTVLLTNSATVPLFGFTAAKYEMNGTIILPLKPGGESGMVFAKNQAIAKTTRGRYGIRTIDGRTVGYFGGIALDVEGSQPRWRHGRSTLYAVDLKTNRARVLAQPPAEDHYRDWLIDRSGNVAVILDISEASGTWKINVPRGAELARGVDPTGNVSLIAFGKGGATAVYAIEDEDGASRWFEVPLAGGEAREILYDTGIERLFVDRGSGDMIGYRTQGETPRTVMDDPAHQSAITRIFKAFSGREAHLIDWTPDFAKVLVRTTGNKDSGTWYLVDVRAKRADPIGYERADIPPEQVGPISVVGYKAQDGLDMDGILTLPPGREAKNLPVILLPHGGPAAHDKAEFDWWAQAFASRGYAVFQPNFRGSTGRTDAFRHAGDGQWGRKMQTDISDGLTELARQGIVDPKRACIVGASYGGYAALAGVTLQQGLYRCVVSVAGVADLKLMYSTDIRESGDSKMLTKSLREQLGDPKLYDDVSPRRFAARADAPVLLIHGKDDTVVGYKQSQVMADALKDARKPYEFVTLAGEDHWLSREETRKRMLSEAVRFVQKNNPAD
jgi:dipeptidyl aminopeptidase/acylaminoacyl peptidase